MRALPLLFAGLVLMAGCRNQPPSVPVLIGPTMARPGEVLEFSAVSADGDGDSVSYRFDWGDGSQSDWSRWLVPGEKYTAEHSFDTVRQFAVRAQARDPGHETDWSGFLDVDVQEYGPFPPHRPTGRDTVTAGDTASFQSLGGHPLGDRARIALRFDWGDGDTSVWSDFHPPGTAVRKQHRFVGPGWCEVRAQALDVAGHLSLWSSPESVLVVDSLGYGS